MKSQSSTIGHKNSQFYSTAIRSDAYGRDGFENYTLVSHGCSTAQLLINSNSSKLLKNLGRHLVIQLSHLFRILFSFETLTIFSLNDWTKRQFRNLDKDSDSKSCPHFRFKIFVINIINTNKAASTTNQLLLNVWFCVA